MPKRPNAKSVRTTRAALATPAARSPQDRLLAVQNEGAVLAPSRPAPPAQPLTKDRAVVLDTYGGASSPDETGAIGTAGNLNVFGFLTGEDYNTDLDGFPMFPHYNHMRLGDAQVNATLLMLKLPVKGARWIVKPASDDPQDVAIADFVQANLIDDDALERSWQHVLDNAMLKFDFGCSAEEVIWGLADGPQLSRLPRLFDLARRPDGGQSLELDRAMNDDVPVYAHVKDLAPRLPRTFYRWIEDPKTGKLKTLQQFAPKNGMYGYWDLPADRLALHVRAREGNNYYGRSVLRTAYPHWWWKQQLYRIDMIGHDRFHVGIPRASLEKDYNIATAPKDKIEETLKGLRSHDRAYMIQPYGVVYDIYGSPTSGQGSTGIITSIEHHNLMVARNILQSFSAQGEQRHGSFGAAKVTVDVYFEALQGEANEISSELKQNVVKRLCDLNFDMRNRKYPTVVCTDISTADFAGMSEAFSNLSNAGIVTPDDGLEQYFRDLADAPGLPEDMKGRDRTPRPQPIAPTPGNPKKPKSPLPDKNAPAIEASRRRSHGYLEEGRRFSRKPTDRERKILDLHGIPSQLDTMQDRLVEQMKSIRLQQLKAVAAKIAQKDGRKTPAFTDIRHEHITMPHQAEMSSAIRAAQTAALNFGRQSVYDELKRQGAKVPKNLATAGDSKRSAKSALVSSARITVKKQAENWRARIMDEALRQRRNGLQGKDLSDKVVAALEDEAESGAKRDAAAELHEGFGIGRDNAARELSDLIETATYSAILDANTCDPCGDLDGEEFEVDSDDYNAVLPPNPNCDGRDACRCVMIYVAAGENA